MPKRAGLFLTLILALAGSLAAADFEIGPQEGSAPQEARPVSRHRASDEGVELAEVPVRLEAGDVMTAYGVRKYELRTDFKFYDGGGILGKAYLGLFPRFFLGGAANVRNFVGSGDLRMRRDDAQLLARLLVLVEDESVPALAIGWDGPAYEHGEAKGLYLSLSKEVPTRIAFLQFHGGVNTANVETFVGNRDLRASAGLTTAIRNVGAFTEVDEALNSAGSRWNAGLFAYFSPITLGIEFRDLASARANTPVSRLLRVSWDGRF